MKQSKRELWTRFKKWVFHRKYRLKLAEARIGHLEKQIHSLQAQLRDATYHFPEFFDTLRTMLAPLVPHTAAGVQKRRVGNLDDGAYVMLDDFKGIAVAYSLGIGKNVSWDLDIAASNIVVHQFDPSVNASPVFHPVFQFNKCSIVGDGKDEPDTMTLARMLNGKVREGEALLKIDIEGAEWDVLDGVSVSLLRCFRQIVVEFHGLHQYRDEMWRERALRVFTKLTSMHRLVHVHGNNFSPTFGAGKRELPYDLEMTFALASAYRLSPSFESFPSALDRPNKMNMPDYDLGVFRF